MGIRVTAGVEGIEALTYDRIFADSIHIDQRRIGNEADAPLYDIRIIYRFFAVDSLGKHHYKEDHHELYIPNYFQVAMSKLSEVPSDPDLMDALVSIEGVLAKLLLEMKGITTVTV